MKTEMELSCPRCMKINLVEMIKFDPKDFNVLNDLVAKCKIEKNGDYSFLGKKRCECGKVICATLTVEAFSPETINAVFARNNSKKTNKD